MRVSFFFFFFSLFSSKISAVVPSDSSAHLLLTVKNRGATRSRSASNEEKRPSRQRQSSRAIRMWKFTRKRRSAATLVSFAHLPTHSSALTRRFIPPLAILIHLVSVPLTTRTETSMRLYLHFHLDLASLATVLPSATRDTMRFSNACPDSSFAITCVTYEVLYSTLGTTEWATSSRLEDRKYFTESSPAFRFFEYSLTTNVWSTSGSRNYRGI